MNAVAVTAGALLAAAVVTAACGSAEKAGDIAPVAGSYLVYEKVTGEKGIWIADSDGQHARLLARGGRGPSISPDGKCVVYLDNYVGNLFLIQRAGGKPMPLARGMYSEQSWSPTIESLRASKMT